jgi:hypothetical protein
MGRIGRRREDITHSKRRGIKYVEETIPSPFILPYSHLGRFLGSRESIKEAS